MQQIIKRGKGFIQQSQKERKVSARKQDHLLRIRSEKAFERPLSPKQRNYVQLIPEDTIYTYLPGREYDLRPRS